MRLFNSRTGNVEVLQPLEPGKVSMYEIGRASCRERVLAGG